MHILELKAARGWRIALYIAGIMYVSIVTTALILNTAFAATGLTPESARQVEDVAQFAIDYTFWLNLLFVAVAAGLAVVAMRYRSKGQDEDGGRRLKPRSWIALAFALTVAVGLIVFAARAAG